jgi:hypothetical protein
VRFYAFSGYLNGFDGSFFVELKAVDAGFAVIAISFGEWPPVVYDVPGI